MATARRRMPIRTARRRVPIRFLSVLAAILVCTKLLHFSLHLEAPSPKYGSPDDLDTNSKEYGSLQQESYRASITTTTSNHVNTTTLLQNKKAAWEFSSNETALLSRSIPVFRSIWHEIQGQGCQKTTVERLPRLQRHVNSLDIFVVSHGGVGSNAIIDYMEQNTSFHAKGDDVEMYQQSCHLGSPVWVPLVRQQATPTLVLLGDFWRALCSMHKRKWLPMNIAKNFYGAQNCKAGRFRNFYIKKFPRDPAGIKMMLLSYILYPDSTVILQAPYTKESINAALTLLGKPDVGSIKWKTSPYESVATISTAKTPTSLSRYCYGYDVPTSMPYRRLEEFLGEMPRLESIGNAP
jgi:hypothetical protein